jgi:hypothetical protein
MVGIKAIIKTCQNVFVFLELKRMGIKATVKNLSNLFCVIRVQVVECNLISAKSWCNNKTWMILV